MSRVTDNSDWQLAPRNFKHFEKRWGPHIVERFASNDNKQMSRYNAKWRDRTAKTVDNLHLPNSEWRREHNLCNSPWELLDGVVVKLRSSGAEATVIAPYWPKKP